MKQQNFNMKWQKPERKQKITLPFVTKSILRDCLSHEMIDPLFLVEISSLCQKKLLVRQTSKNCYTLKLLTIARCPKNNLKLCIMYKWSGYNGIYLAFVNIILAQKQDHFHCICSNRGRLGFYSDTFMGQCTGLNTICLLLKNKDVKGSSAKMYNFSP